MSVSRGGSPDTAPSRVARRQTRNAGLNANNPCGAAADRRCGTKRSSSSTSTPRFGALSHFPIRETLQRSLPFHRILYDMENAHLPKALIRSKKVNKLNYSQPKVDFGHHTNHVRRFAEVRPNALPTISGSYSTAVCHEKEWPFLVMLIKAGLRGPAVNSPISSCGVGLSSDRSATMFVTFPLLLEPAQLHLALHQWWQIALPAPMDRFRPTFVKYITAQ
jgi:hypothetical protein